MKRPTIIILIILFVMIVVVGAYEAHHQTTKSKSPFVTNTKASADAAPSKTSAKSTPSTAAGGFAPVSTNGLAYEATINTTNGDGSIVNAPIDTDGKGTTQYSTVQAADTLQITYTPTAFYTCTSGTCYKYPPNQGSTTDFDPASYAYTSAQLTADRNSAVYKGQQSCKSGTCDVWSVTSGSSTSELYIDASTKRITEVKTSDNGKTSSITYDYKPVSVTIPANATSITSTPQ